MVTTKGYMFLPDGSKKRFDAKADSRDNAEKYFAKLVQAGYITGYLLLCEEIKQEGGEE